MGLGEKKQTVMQYNAQGLKLAIALPIAKLSKAQYYHRPKQGKPGRIPSDNTLKMIHDQQKVVANVQVVEQIKQIQKDPDLNYGYRTMTKSLQMTGYSINHKKVYRLMKENSLLKDKRKITSKPYVKYRKVQPTQPLEVLEMDIKVVWIERDKRHAFALNIIDTFSRKWLYQCASFSIKAPQVEKAWEHIIAEHLQPNDCLNRPISIEVRNDNDKRFSAQMVQDFFKENHLNQVFTHPYTPQENGHIESFHGILSEHLKRFTFWSLDELEQNLILFQEKYNNQRLHGSIAHVCPNDFEQLWAQDLVQISSNLKHKTIRFKLKIPHHKVKQITGNHEPEGSLSPDFEPLDGVIKSKNIEMNGANISNNLRCKQSPSVVSRSANISTKFCTIVKPKC